MVHDSRMRCFVLLGPFVALGCSGPVATPAVMEPSPPVEPVPAVPATPAERAWKEIRSWDGLFSISVPEEAEVQEFLAALVPVRGSIGPVSFMVRFDKPTISTEQLVSYETYDGKVEIELDSAQRVRFRERFVEVEPGAQGHGHGHGHGHGKSKGKAQGNAKGHDKVHQRVAHHDVAIARGKQVSIVWESVAILDQEPDAATVALQAEMAARFKVGKVP